MEDYAQYVKNLEVIDPSVEPLSLAGFEKLREEARSSIIAVEY